MTNIIIDDSHFDYLVIQKGDVSDHRHDRVKWQAAYEEALSHTYQTILPYLPEKCSKILDVGSGLGGIDIILNRHYNNKCSINLLDGSDDKPIVNKHAQTFSNHAVARDFHEKNGTDMKRFDYISPERALNWIRPRPVFSRCDLIVSFASFCFHYKPETYLPFLIKEMAKKDTVFIFDVRVNDEYEKTLSNNFNIIDIVYKAPKFNRMVLKQK